MGERTELRLAVESGEEVSALLLEPPDARWLLLFAHGAGAGMRHPFMESMAGELARRRIGTLRYQFPYMEQRRGRPDPPAVLARTVAAAARAARERHPGLPLIAGGKSMGGRMTSEAAAEGLVPEVRGIVFFGFPLHPPKAPGVKRAAHLEKVRVPMLFLQGTRDTLADLTLLRPICEKLRPLTTLEVIDSADHSFHVLKRSGTTDQEVLTGLAESTASWAGRL